MFRSSGAPHAVLLAAGAARRFGSPKLLALLEGRPVISHLRETLERAQMAGLLGAVHAVIRQDAPAALAALLPDSWQVRVAHAEPGLSDSLKAGVAAARHADAPAALLCLADQPRLTLDTIRALVGAWQAGADLVRPTYSDEPGIPGHPLLIDRARFALVARTIGDRGLEPVLAADDLSVELVSRPGRHPDLDTPDDLTRL